MTLRARVAALVVMGALGVLGTGCVRDPRVVRVYDGKVMVERFVPPDAYAAFLRGVLAEEGGDLRSALAAYTEIADDDDDPEVWSRIGGVLCRLEPKSAEVDRAFARATKADPASASALAAAGRCATLRGRHQEAAELARRAAAQDPTNVGLEAQVIRASAARSDAPDPAMRERAVASTRAHGERAAAWDALLVWGRAHRDQVMVIQALEGLIRTAPTRSVEAESAALQLLAAGELLAARRLAVAVADAPRELGVVGPRDETVARLAVDEALARGDAEVTGRRATRGHVPGAELAARALLLERRDLAQAIVGRLLLSEPTSSGALMVKEALRAPSPPQGSATPPAAAPAASSAKADPSRALLETLAKATDRPPALCAFVLADRLASTLGTEAAREWLARVTRAPAPARDPVAAPLVLTLTARGILPASLPSAEARAAAP